MGLALGFTIGLVAGPAAGAIRPAAPPAGAAGVVLRVSHDNADLRRILGSHGPVRLDEIGHDGQPIGTVTSAGSGSLVEEGKERTKDIAANAHGDDYHEQR